jgi:hypothetical protein
MAMKANFTGGDIEKSAQEQKDKLYGKIIQAFQYAGEKFIINARGQYGGDGAHESGMYVDQSSNLRNSIGYFIIHDGEIVSGSAPGKAVARPGHEAEAISPEELIKNNQGKIQEFVKTSGFQFIGIAGMNYASYVESKGYNVISFQADLCLVDLTLYLEDLDLVEKGRAAQIEETFIPE